MTKEQRAGACAGDVDAGSVPDWAVVIEMPLWLFVIVLPIAPTMVTSSPSSIQTVPSPTKTSQCHLDHGRRSSRAGTSVSMTAPSWRSSWVSLLLANFIVRVAGCRATSTSSSSNPPVDPDYSTDQGVPLRAPCQPSVAGRSCDWIPVRRGSETPMKNG